jgi:hypothetical protein
MKLTEQDKQELDSAMNCLYQDGLDDGDLGFLHRSKQIDLIREMIKYIEKQNQDAST